MTRPDTLVLFDIDGTLLDVHGAGRLSFARALEHCFGWKNELKHIRFAGATDLDLLHRLLREHGREPSARDEALFFERLPVELRAAIAGRPAGDFVYPGVVALVEHLARRPQVLLGLVTGNIERCAWIKLEAADLRGHFVLGAYGHEHADRNEIARLALRRAEERAGGSFSHVVLLGDTPNDVRAARTIGARAAAVATGSFTRRQLEETGADVVFDDLSDIAAVSAGLGVGRQGR